MVELDVEARQGDSGGPIFNERGELAGVLFGAGQGTTLGSFGGRVESFLASIAPGIGRATDDALLAGTQNPPSDLHSSTRLASVSPFSDSPQSEEIDTNSARSEDNLANRGSVPPGSQESNEKQIALLWQHRPEDEQQGQVSLPRSSPPQDQSPFAHVKTLLAAVGLFSLVTQLLKAAR